MTLDADQYRRGLWKRFIESNLRVARINGSPVGVTTQVPNHMIFETDVWFYMDKNRLRVIETKMGEFEDLIFPFIAKGVQRINVFGRTIKKWNDIPSGLKSVQLQNCIIPSLNDAPEFDDLHISTDKSFSHSIVSMFENTCKADGRQAVFSITDGILEILRIYRWYNEPITVRHGGIMQPETQLNDVFDLQSWLMDNDFSRLA